MAEIIERRVRAVTSRHTRPPGSQRTRLASPAVCVIANQSNPAGGKVEGQNAKEGARRPHQGQGLKDMNYG